MALGRGQDGLGGKAGTELGHSCGSQGQATACLEGDQGQTSDTTSGREGGREGCAPGLARAQREQPAPSDGAGGSPGSCMIFPDTHDDNSSVISYSGTTAVSERSCCQLVSLPCLASPPAVLCLLCCCQCAACLCFPFKTQQCAPQQCGRAPEQGTYIMGC